MATIEGYSEEAVDVLEAEFAKVIQSSIVNVLARTANALQPAIVADAAGPIVFHLPGKHDQATHGRPRARDITALDPYADWGGNGKAPWMASHDIHLRSTNLWSESFEGQRAIRETMDRIHAGDLDPTADVKVEGALAHYASTFRYDTGEKYGDERVKDDIYNAAQHLDGLLEDAPVVSTTMYRGVRVEKPLERFKVGDTFDSHASSWTPHRKIAEHYTGIEAAAGRHASGRPVIMKIEGGVKALSIDDGSLRRVGSGHGEHLVRGTFKIVKVERDVQTDELLVTVRQMWATV